MQFFVSLWTGQQSEHIYVALVEKSIMERLILR